MANVTSLRQDDLDTMLQEIFKARPGLVALASDRPILDYLKTAIQWPQHTHIYPYTGLLQSIILSHIDRLYGRDTAEIAEAHFKESWVIETGAHLHIPRRYNNVGKKEGPQINSLLFQGQVLWSLANQATGRQISLSLNSGRVPLDNTNSGAYLDLPSLKTPITLASKKHHPDSPQSLIPARLANDIQEKRDLLDMYKKQKMLPEDEYILGQEILENFQNVQSSFSDQVASTHALMLNKFLPITQVTLDSELIGKEFMLKLLHDPNSLTYNIFADKSKRMMFIELLSGIRTGWVKGDSPFYLVARKDEGFRLTRYDGELTPEVIIKGLEQNTLWITGIMKYFIFMAEAGLLSVGGWTQAGYCTELRNKAATLLRLLGLKDRAKSLSQMPTFIAAVGPCWGIDEIDGYVQLLDPVTTILDPDSFDYPNIKFLTGNQTLQVAAPTLYQFLTGEQPLRGYAALLDRLDFALIKRSISYS